MCVSTVVTVMGWEVHTPPGAHRVSDLLLLSLTLFLTSLPRASSPIKYTLLTATGEQMGLSEPIGTQGYCCCFALILIPIFSHPLQLVTVFKLLGWERGQKLMSDFKKKQDSPQGYY